MILYDSDMPISPELMDLMEKVVEASLDTVDFPYETEVSVTCVSNEEMQSINKEHRDKDTTTDVLSFPQIDWESPCDYDFLDNYIGNYMNPDTGFVILGDIVLNLDRAREQSIEFGHSYQREVGFLVAHSMLHLMGYDHMEVDDEAIMLPLQNKIMEKLNLSR